MTYPIKNGQQVETRSNVDFKLGDLRDLTSCIFLGMVHATIDHTDSL